MVPSRHRGRRGVALPIALSDPLAYVGATERGAHGLTHGDERFVTGSGRIVAHMKLDAIRDRNSPPARRAVIVRIAYGDVCLRTECRCK